jgi:hypothetical protein
MTVVNAKPKRGRLRHDWRYRFVAGRDRLLTELGIEHYALELYGAWTASHERIVQSLAEFTNARPKTEATVGFGLKALGLRRTQKLYQASLMTLRSRQGAHHDVLPQLLEAMAEFERFNRAAPLSAARRVRELLSTDEGRNELALAAGKALDKHPDSPFLIYLRSASLAKGGDLSNAHDLVTAAIRRCQEATASGILTERIDRRYKRLESAWRVVDWISRDEATWSDGSIGTPEWVRYDGLAPFAAAHNRASTSDAYPDGQSPDPEQMLVFSEQLIQGRQHERYLEACKRDFDDADGLFAKFKVVRDMMREARRPIVSYRAAYDAARACFEELRPRWERLAEFSYIDSRAGSSAMRANARQLAEALRIARQLQLEADVERLERSLLYLAGKPAAVTALWSACNALVDDKTDAYIGTTIALVAKARRAPQAVSDIREYFIWTRHVRRYDLAHALFDRLPERLKLSKASLQYAHVLQQEGQFARAAELVRAIHEEALRHPGSIDPNFSWSQIRRAGELQFAAETAEYFAAFPQPSEPRGVIFLAPRNVSQMRQYPLVVLMEMKRHGWAIVPLTKGVLPLEPTGNAKIDRFLGCLTADGRFDPRVAETFPDISGFEADVEQGRLRWNAISLDHILWEEAAINRRRYHAVFTCPALKPFLDRLVHWTKIHAILLSEIRDTLVADGARCGFLVLQQARLPEAMVRFYLEEFGSPDDYFCIHATNGYQNYFANFNEPVSTRMALRNMTRHRTLRTASAPEPGEFEAFYQKNQARGGELLQAVQEIIRARRATAGLSERLPEATACVNRILEWRQLGGKVACLFGKVVCDSSVPFDGGPAHANMKDWLNHAIESVRDSNTLLLIKPHPHEIRNEIGLFMTEHFPDLIDCDLPDNVILLGHRWFDVHDLVGLIDLGVVYNGTSAVELGVLDIPCVLSGHFAPIDHPIGHAVPQSRDHFRRLLRFEEKAIVAPDLKGRAAAWLSFMSGDGVARDYRYHARQITNKRLLPPWWFREDIERYLAEGDRNIELLAEEILATDASSAAPNLQAAQ